MLVTLPLVLYGMFRYRPLSERDIPLLLSVAVFGLTAFAVLALDQ